MSVALLVDFGSTYTKVAAMDLATDRFLGRAQSPSTVETDVSEGLLRAVSTLGRETGLSRTDFSLKLACSSAAGGLKIVAVGLIERLTAEAANRAALGAGAKVIGVLARNLDHRTIREIEMTNPDVILLAGGVDGGNDEVIIGNARMIAACKARVPVVVAGNSSVTEQVCEIIRDSGRSAFGCPNVMPALNKLNVEPARKIIQEVFIGHITKAKGLDRALEFVGGVVMPTPLAVLNMTELLAQGVEGEAGLGDTVVLDIGGATTDVHSACWGHSRNHETPMLGLPEPFAKRTVEGDLGLRVSIMTLIEAARESNPPLPPPIAEVIHTEDALQRARRLNGMTYAVPRTSADHRFDEVMAKAAAWIAVGRHAGTAVSDGRTGFTVQYGKDLSRVRALIGTGGIFAQGASPYAALQAGMWDRRFPFSLRPVDPEIYVDAHYIMYAGGLLATKYPHKALRLMKSSLRRMRASA